MDRLDEAREAGAPAATLHELLDAALQALGVALSMLPMEAADDRAISHNVLAAVFSNAGDVDEALRHWREAIRCCEAYGDVFHAGHARYNIAVMLTREQRLPEALLYARAALSNYESFGERAAGRVRQAQELIAQIEAGLAQQPGGEDP